MERRNNFWKMSRLNLNIRADRPYVVGEMFVTEAIAPLVLGFYNSMAGLAELRRCRTEKLQPPPTSISSTPLRGIKANRKRNKKNITIFLRDGS
jgi:hypothetical protein